MPDRADRARLFLVTPPEPDRDAFPAVLARALAAADIAAVLIAADRRGRQSEALAGEIVPLIQGTGAAALVADDTRLAGRLKADGVHVESGLGDLRVAADSFRPQRIVGAGNIQSRHAAMEAGEAGADYLLFGRPHGDTHDLPHPKALDLAAWWSELMELPAVVMAGRSLHGVAAAAATGAEFVGVNAFVWTHPAGAEEAVRQAAEAIAQGRPEAA